MGWATEKDIRMFILSKLNVKAVLIAQLYTELESVASEKQKPLDLDLEKLAA